MTTYFKETWVKPRIDLHIYHHDQLLEARWVRLEYEQQGKEWHPPSFQAKLINNAHRSLYCALLHLTEECSVSAPFFGSGAMWLEAKREIWLTIADGTQLKGCK